MKTILKDFIRMVLGMADEEPIADRDLWFTLSGLLFIILMLTIISINV